MINTVNQAWAFVLVGGCGLLAGVLIATFAAWKIAHAITKRLLKAERQDAQRELCDVMRDRDKWRNEARRLRASIDGADDYRPTPQPTFPRPLSHR